jgi:hypothetical protein
MTMSRTRRTIGLGALVVLVVFGAGWALGKATSNSQSKGGAAISAPANPSGAVPAAITGTQSPPKEESDRSDLILIQG